jgi:hypothetical protein
MAYGLTHFDDPVTFDEHFPRLHDVATLDIEQACRVEENWAPRRRL